MKDKMLDRVYKYMVRFGTITTWQAYEDLGCTRLSEYIRQLREIMIIDDEWVCKKNRFGEPIHFKKYWISEKNTKIIY